MKLSELSTLIRAMTPGITVDKVTPEVLNLIINSIIVDITSKSLCLPTNTTFNVVADQQTYDLATLITNYLCPDKSGLWWYNGSKWDKVDSKTLQWLDDNIPTWRDYDSGDPQYCSIDSNILTVVNKPDTSLANGFKLYHIRKPGIMSSNDHYPFTGTTTEYSHLSIFDWPIIYGSRWKLKATIGEYRDEYSSDQNLYLKTLALAISEFKRRPDISAQAQMRGPSVRA